MRKSLWTEQETSGLRVEVAADVLIKNAGINEIDRDNLVAVARAIVEQAAEDIQVAYLKDQIRQDNNSIGPIPPKLFARVADLSWECFRVSKRPVGDGSYNTGRHYKVVMARTDEEGYKISWQYYLTLPEDRKLPPTIYEVFGHLFEYAIFWERGFEGLGIGPLLRDEIKTVVLDTQRIFGPRYYEMLLHQVSFDPRHK